MKKSIRVLKRFCFKYSSLTLKSYSPYILLILFISCSSSDDTINSEKEANLAPAEFEITVSDITDRSAVITWTDAVDPDGDQVNYRLLFMNQEIERTNNSNNFVFRELEPEMKYQVKIEASDGDLLTTSEISFTTVPFNPKIYEGNVRLQSQSEVEEFGKEDYNIINGWLEIMDQYGPDTNISDLSPLSGLMEIRGELRIFKSQLKDLQGFNNLESVKGPVDISSNDKLINLQGLEDLTSIEGRLSIGGNLLLENIDPFSKVQGIKELLLTNNSKIVRVNLMQDEEVVYFVNISGNETLEILEGLEKVKEVQTHIQIHDNPVLETLPQFLELTRVEKQISIANSLSTSIGFPKLESAGSLYLDKNVQLKNLNGFQNLTAVGSNVIISDNNLLEDFCNFSSLTPPPGTFLTYGNAYNPNIDSIKAGDCKPEN